MANMSVRHATTPTTRRRKRPMRADQRQTVVVSSATLMFVTVMTLFPIFWIVLTSLNVGNSFASGFLPSQFTFSHYANVLQHTDFLLWIANTVLVGSVTGVLEVVTIILLAYSFSRFRFAGRRWGLVLLVAMQMFPAIMALSADYYLVNWVSENWIPVSDNYVGLIVIYVGTSVPFNAWLFKGYIDSLPRELEEAAYIDGANRFMAFWSVIVPLCRPMMAFIFIQAFLACANEWLLVSILVVDESRRTFSVGLLSFALGNFTTNWTDFAAAAVMGSIPFVCIFLLAQRWFISGLAGGAVKG